MSAKSLDKASQAVSEASPPSLAGSACVESILLRRLALSTLAAKSKPDSFFLQPEIAREA